jgi:hypothetical protein
VLSTPLLSVKKYNTYKRLSLFILRLFIYKFLHNYVMQIRIGKIAAIIGGGTLLALGGVFFVRSAVAETAMDCNSSSGGFWGYIACYIGSPSNGISGADTLFKGQKAIYDKIGTSGGGATASAGLGVYLETNGRSDYYGRLVEFVPPDGGTFWGIANAITGCGSMDCPTKPFDTQGDASVLAVFYPTDSVINFYGLTKNRRGLSIKPTMCYVKQEQKVMTTSVSTANQGVADVERITMRCSYIPNICNSLHSSGIGQYGCLGSSDFVRTVVDYTTNTPSVAEQFRIRVK